MTLAPVFLDLFVLLAKQILQYVHVLVELLNPFVLVLHLVRLILLAFIANLGF